MSKRTIIILSAVVPLLAGLIIGAIIFFTSRNGGAPSESGGFFSNLFPGGGERDIIGEEEGRGEDITQGKKTTDNILFQLANSSVAGATAVSSASSTSVRYVEKSTGHIYEISPQGKDRKRVSNTTILKVFETFWSPDADKIVMRYFDEDAVSNFSAKFSTSTAAIEGIFLPQEITAVAVSSAEDKIFYLQKTNGATYGVLADFAGKSKENIFSSPFGEFNISWPAKNIIALVAKPSVGADGYLYFLDVKTKEISRMIGGIKGLTALISPKADKIIYSQSVNNGFSTKIFDVKSKTSSNFGLTTMPEKCVWSKINSDIIFCAAPKSFPSADYPDEWYQGAISFDDAVWQINIATGETQVIFNETNADVINPFLSADESYFLFTNKNDLTLWSLKLK